MVIRKYCFSEVHLDIIIAIEFETLAIKMPCINRLAIKLLVPNVGFEVPFNASNVELNNLFTKYLKSCFKTGFTSYY